MIDSRIVIGFIAVFISMVVMGIAGIQEQDRMAMAEESQHAISIQRGAVLFEEACSDCHGPDGPGVVGRAPALNAADLFDDSEAGRLKSNGYQGTLESYLTLTVAGGRPIKTSDEYGQPMPTWGQQYGGPYRPDQVKDVVAFVMNWGLAPGESASGAAAVECEAGDAACEGQQLFVSNGCVACHAYEGLSQAAVGPDLTTVGQQGADYIRTSIVDPSAVIAEGFADGLMPKNFADLIPAEDIDRIVTFLESGN